MQKLLLLPIFLILCSGAFSNPPDSIVRMPPVTGVKGLYHINHWVSGAIILAGAATDYIAIARIKNKPAITNSELADLNPKLLNFFDRWGLHQNPADRALFKTISDDGQIPIDALPFLLLLDKNISKEWSDLLFMYLEGHVITFTFYNYSPLGPTFQNRYRPMTYYTEFSNDQRESGNNRNSFYSGHVASCTFSTFFMAKVYCDYHPDLGARKFLVYGLATIPSLAMSYFRIKALDHFPSDCVVGFGLGAAVGIILPELQKYHDKNISLGLFTTPGSAGLSMFWNFKGLNKKVHSLAGL